MKAVMASSCTLLLVQDVVLWHYFSLQCLLLDYHLNALNGTVQGLTQRLKYCIGLRSSVYSFLAEPRLVQCE